jgi:transposase
VLDQIKVLDRQLMAPARSSPVAGLIVSAPGISAITTHSVASAFDPAERFQRSSSAGPYLGLTPRRYESGEVSRNGRISKHGSPLTRKHHAKARELDRGVNSEPGVMLNPETGPTLAIRELLREQTRVTVRPGHGP